MYSRDLQQDEEIRSSVRASGTYPCVAYAGLILPATCFEEVHEDAQLVRQFMDQRPFCFRALMSLLDGHWIGDSIWEAAGS